jgi:hypothetical protein
VGEREVRAELTSAALGDAGWQGFAIPAAAFVLGVGVPMTVGLLLLAPQAPLPIAGVVLASIAAGLSALFFAARQLAAARRRRLFEIGRGFDPRAYLEALGEKRKYGVLVVRARFARPWPDDARASAKDTVRAWMPALEEVAWDGDALELRSEGLAGTERLERGPIRRIFSNKDFHGCFLTVTADVLPRLDAIAPIVSLDASIEGDSQPWDAKPD